MVNCEIFKAWEALKVEGVYVRLTVEENECGVSRKFGSTTV